MSVQNRSTWPRQHLLCMLSLRNKWHSEMGWSWHAWLVPNMCIGHKSVLDRNKEHRLSGMFLLCYSKWCPGWILQHRCLYHKIESSIMPLDRSRRSHHSRSQQQHSRLFPDWPLQCGSAPCMSGCCIFSFPCNTPPRWRCKTCRHNKLSPCLWCQHGCWWCR